MGLIPSDSRFPRYIVSQSQMKLTVNPAKADARFVYYFFRHPNTVQTIKSRAITSGVPHINLGILREFALPLPPLKIQQEIVAVLSTYDELMENNRRRMGLLEEAARLLYREWFVRLRFPGHEHTRITNGVPDGWEMKSLGEAVGIKKGRNITLATVQDGMIPVVAGGLSPAYFHNEANVVGPVITISASGANAGFVNLYQEDIWASDCSYISFDSTCHLFYYFCLLKFRQDEVFGFQKGAAQPHVYPKDLMRLTISNPPENILQHFMDAVTPFFASIKNLNTQNQKLRAARDLLLPRLMSGEIAV